MRSQAGSDNNAWKGAEAGYMAIHNWMRRHHPKTGRCERCGTERYTEYAQKDHGKTTRNRADWLELCKPCHLAFDGGIWNLGKSPNSETRAKMSTAARARWADNPKTHCKHGHAFDEANTYYYKSGKRACRACNRERARKRAQGLVPRPGT